MATVGIDLGTTNSLVSVWQDDKCTLIPNNLGEYLTPSVVGIDENGEMLVGRTAKERLISHPESTVASFKRFMGTEKTFMLGNRRFTAADLSSMVLRQLKEDAEKYLGESVEEAVISVPAYFNDFQRNATKMAGELAGLTVERLVNEPSAAALAYRFGKTKEDQTFLVFDFGGGTLDISIVDAFDSVIEIVAVAGDNHLGGDDVNRAIAEKFLSVNRIDEGKITNEERASLIRESEKLKRTLTDAPEGEMEVVIGGQIYQMKLDAKGLLEVSAKLLEGIGIPLKRAMNDSGYGWEDIDEIIMIGGSGKMKIVQNYLQFLSGKRPRCEIDPDVAVAVGAECMPGLRNDSSSAGCTSYRYMSVYIGTEIIHGDTKGPAIMSPIIERNSVLPISRVERYWTVHQFQEYCDITILQGEHRYADQNLELGRIRVPVPLARREDQREAVDVRFTYDINGILEVDVTVVSTKEHFSKVIVNKDIHLTPEQIEGKKKRTAED